MKQSAACALLYATVIALAQSGSGPRIAYGVVGAADYAGGVSAGIPRGSIFTILGVQLALSEARAAQLPLPALLNGVRVKIWSEVGGDSVEAPLLYVSPQQINAILLSSVPEGYRYISVQVNGVEGPVESFTVVGRRFAAFTQSATGFGPAALLNVDSAGNVALNQFTRPAHPGQAVSLWGTGLGPLPSGSDFDSPAASDLASDVTVYVAGTAVKPLYAGRAPGLPGVDQINFVLPSGLPDRCFVPLIVQTAGRDSNDVTLAVAQSDAPCKSEFGLSRAALDSLDNGGVVRGAVLSFISDRQSSQLQQTVEAWIAEYDAASLGLLAAADPVPAARGAGACARREYSIPPRSGPLRASPANMYGLRRLFPSFSVSIRGASGCSWPAGPVTDNIVRADDNGGCIASNFSFQGSAGSAKTFLANGILPRPRDANTIDRFSATQSAEALTASWHLASTLPNDLALLTAQNRFVLPGNLFGGLTYVNELSCRAGALDGSFSFPPAAGQWQSILMNLATETDQVFAPDSPDASATSVDFVLVRIRNGTTATATTIFGPVTR